MTAPRALLLIRMFNLHANCQEGEENTSQRDHLLKRDRDETRR